MTQEQIDLIKAMINQFGGTVADLQDKPEKWHVISEDKVKMYDGETPVWVYSDNHGVWFIGIQLPLANLHKKTATFIIAPDKVKIFSTREAAQSFIEKENKPKIEFKCEDGVITDTDSIVYFYFLNPNDFSISGQLWVSVAEQVVEDTKWFSTPEARDKYIQENKPLYSLKDVEKAIDLWDRNPSINGNEYFIINELKNIK